MRDSINVTAIDWSQIKAVIFDVDGTLYDQRRLRLNMISRLLGYYALRPWRYRELKILQVFRRERERHALGVVKDIEHSQYIWAADSLGLDYHKVCSVVEQWIVKTPLQYMFSYRYLGVAEFFAALRRRQIIIAILSDYPAVDKLKALSLDADLVVAATDAHVDRLKPDPRGLLYIVSRLNLSVADCLFIGDRDAHDGECARRAGMAYLIMERGGTATKNRFSSYHELNQQLAVKQL